MAKGKWLLAAAIGVGLGWASLEVEFGGKTAYTRFAEAGGQEAVQEGWAWIRGRIAGAAHRAGAWIRAQASGAWTAAHRAFEQWVAGWFDDGVSEARLGPDRTGPNRPADDRESPTPTPRPPAPRAAPRAHGGGAPEVRALAEASALAGPSPADKPRTHVDPRIEPADRAALDAKIARALEER